MSAQDDAKLMQLVIFLQKLKQDGQKVILFTERLSTAIYLEETLQAEAPEIVVVNTVAQTRMDRQGMVQELGLSRICALYLVPEEKEPGLERVLGKKTAI